jgi:hypothetical protein
MEILQVMFHGLLGNKKQENYSASVQNRLQNCQKLRFFSATGSALPTFILQLFTETLGATSDEVCGGLSGQTQNEATASK